MKNTDFNRLKKIAKSSLAIIDQNGLVSNNKIRVSNLETSLEVEVNITGTGVIPLKAIEKDFDKGWIEGEQLFIQRGSNVSTFSVYKTDEFPLAHAEDMFFGDEFLFNNVEEIKKVVSFCGNDDLRPYTKGVFIDIKNNMAVATDLFMMRNIEISPAFDQSITLPKETVLLLKNEAYNVKFHVNGTNKQYDFAVFSTAEETIYTRIIEGRYPEWKNIIPKNQNWFSVNAKEFINQLTLSLSATNKTTNQIALSIKNNLLIIHAENLDENSEYLAEIKAKQSPFDGRFTIGVNAKYLIKALKLIEKEVDATLSYSAANRAMILNENILIMPVMLDSKIDYDKKVNPIPQIEKTVEIAVDLKNEIEKRPEFKGFLENNIVIAKPIPITEQPTDQPSENIGQLEQPEESPIQEIENTVEITDETEQLHKVFIIKDYTPKSFLVIGNFDAIAEELAKCGRFTRKMRVGEMKVDAYWCSNKRLETVRQIIKNA